MKWLVIALLLANVVVLGWQFNEHIRAQTVAAAGLPDLPRDAPSLRLVSELPGPPARREPPRAQLPQTISKQKEIIEAVDLSTEINSDNIPSNVCIDIGPIADKEKLDNLRAWLRERTTTVHTRAETVRERRFFWVYLEPASDDEARENLDDLKRRGVTDYMLIRRGGLKNAISLGLFRSQDSVNRRLAEMGRQGYKPVVVPKFEKTENYWIKATMAQGAEDTSQLPAALLADASLKTNECEPGSDVGESAVE